MSQGYVPGLFQRPETRYKKIRELPLPGKSLVRIGDVVRADQPVLEALLPGDIRIIHLSKETGFEPAVVRQYVAFEPGMQIQQGQLLCSIPYFFGFFKAAVHSPVTGEVEFFTPANAHLGIRESSKPLRIDAYVPGTITHIEAGRSIEIEGVGAFIQGIFGVGGERQGQIFVLPVERDVTVTAEILAPFAERCRGSILVGGSCYSVDGLNSAAQYGASAVLTGSIDSQTLRNFVGFEIGVSMTGDENVPFSFIVTEGFGRLPISPRVLEILRPHDGKFACVNGATQVRAGAMRPELIVPLEVSAKTTDEAATSSLEIGTIVRAIREPFFGKLGAVRALPSDPQLIPSGATVRVAEVEIDGQIHQIPRANLELVLASA